MLKSSYIRFRITIYNPIAALSKLRSEKIPVRDFKKVEDYVYEFSCSPIYLKRILVVFEEADIITRHGPLSLLQNLWFKKTTLIALLIASIFFYDVSSRVHKITVTGVNRTINTRMLVELKEMGIVKYIKQPSYDALIECEDRLKNIFHQEVEFIELRLKGANIVLNYTPRRDEVIIPEKKGSLYAKKDGMISYFVVSSGDKMVKENQFVREGDLLISDRILTPSGEEVIIGAYGQVYAHTWTIVEVSRTNLDNFDSAAVFQELLNDAHRMMSGGFYLDEKIIEENVLQYNYATTKSVLKMHFTCLEDIAN